MVLIVVGSRERPGMVARLMACCPGLPMVVCIDETEPRTEEYRALGVDLIVRPGESAGVAAKIAHAVENRPAERYALLSDRCVPHPGWYEAMARGLVTFCDCRFKGQPRTGFSAVFAVSRKAIDAVGWIVPPGVDHYGVDNFWNHAARLAGVAVETKARVDIPDYQASDGVRARTVARRAEFAAQWERFRASPEFAAAVERLKAESI